MWKLGLQINVSSERSILEEYPQISSVVAVKTKEQHTLLKETGKSGRPKK